MVLLGLALILPACLRALDSEMLRVAGRDSRQIEEIARHHLLLEKPAIAEMLIRGAKQCGVKGFDDVDAMLKTYQKNHPELAFWGGSFAELETIAVPDLTHSSSLLSALIRESIRESILIRLLDSRRPGVQAILENRSLSHTETFLPVGTSGGAVLGSMIVANAWLAQGDYLKDAFRKEIEGLANEANRGQTAAMESFYLDLLVFAKRLNWAQFSGLMSRIEDRKSLRHLAHTITVNPDALPSLFSICMIASSTSAVSDYLDRFPETALTDLSFGMTCQQGGVESILTRQERVYHSAFRQTLRRLLPFESMWNGAAEFVFRFPLLMIFVKYLFILIGSFCWIRFLGKYLTRPKSSQRHPFESAVLFRQQIMAMGMLMLFILFSEPFLAEKEQSEETPPNWNFQAAFAAIAPKADMDENVNELTILVLVLFFIIQIVLYALGLAKLKEISNAKAPPSLKLKLLDNEENMFDSGLYVGLGGTILSLLVLTINLAKVGLMAAYASTLFGIIFVAVLKIFHVRPARRKFLIESEASLL